MDFNLKRKELGKQISRLRISRNMSQEELSDLTGIAKANIARIEEGRYSAREDTIFSILDALRADINLFFPFEEKTYILMTDGNEIVNVYADKGICEKQKLYYEENYPTLTFSIKECNLIRKIK